MEIPKVDICMLSEYREDDIMVSRFSEYLSRHHNLIAPHRHSFYHILFFTEGGGRHTIDFAHFDVRPFQIYFMVPGQVHSWDFEGRVEGYIVNFSPGFFKSFLLKPDYLDSFSFFRGITRNSVLNLEGRTKEEVWALFRRLIGQGETRTDYRNDMIRILLLQIFITIQKSDFAVQEHHEIFHTSMLLRNYQKLIERNYLSLRLPSEYASLLYITPNHLNALCKEHLGVQAGKLIRDRIVLEAKRLLVNMDLSISEIAYKLNFNDNSYFTRFFRKEVGITPEAFRKGQVKDRGSESAASPV